MDLYLREFARCQLGFFVYQTISVEARLPMCMQYAALASDKYFEIKEAKRLSTPEI